MKDTIVVMAQFPMLVNRRLNLTPFLGLFSVLDDVVKVRPHACENTAPTICHRGQSSDFILRSGSKEFRH